LTLVALLGVALTVMVPSMLATGLDATALVTVALMSLGLAALARFGHHGGALAARTIAVIAHKQGDLIVTPTRVTDPVHHPVRPRAPGTV
jgi:hypothetical protein